MKTKLIIAATAVFSFGAGIAAGWFARKRQEIQFVETTEEDLQAYASQFEGEGEESESSDEKQDDEEEVPKTEEESVPGYDPRKVDYASSWKHDEIVKREGYGEPTPGDPEDLSPTEADLDPEFAAAIEEENLPRFEGISGTDFYSSGGKGIKQEVYFWYDRDDVITEQIDDEEERVLEDDELRRLGFNIRKEFESRQQDIEEEIAGSGLMLYLEDHERDVVISLVRYPMSYGKRHQQEEYGGTESAIDRIHRRNGSIY